MGESLPGRRAISPVELLVHGVVVVVFKVVVVVSGGVEAVILSVLLLIGLPILEKEIDLKVLFEGMGTSIHRSLLSSLCSRDRHRAWSICNL